jgi:hemoglobin
MTTHDRPASEADITALVARFYALALADDLLGPMFRATIPDLEPHLRIVENFWSAHLLGTARYTGSAYPQHVHLKVEPAHFERWMAAFTQAVDEILPAAAADSAMRRARQMTAAFKAGMLPLPPTRHPAAQAGAHPATLFLRDTPAE